MFRNNPSWGGAARELSAPRSANPAPALTPPGAAAGGTRSFSEVLRGSATSRAVNSAPATRAAPAGGNRSLGGVVRQSQGQAARPPGNLGSNRRAVAPAPNAPRSSFADAINSARDARPHSRSHFDGRHHDGHFHHDHNDHHFGHSRFFLGTAFYPFGYYSSYWGPYPAYGYLYPRTYYYDYPYYSYYPSETYYYPYPSYSYDAESAPSGGGGYDNGSSSPAPATGSFYLLGQYWGLDLRSGAVRWDQFIDTLKSTLAHGSPSDVEEFRRGFLAGFGPSAQEKFDQAVKDAGYELQTQSTPGAVNPAPPASQLPPAVQPMN